jgi:hypothetical protein
MSLRPVFNELLDRSHVPRRDLVPGAPIRPQLLQSVHSFERAFQLMHAKDAGAALRPFVVETKFDGEPPCLLLLLLLLLRRRLRRGGWPAGTPPLPSGACLRPLSAAAGLGSDPRRGAHAGPRGQRGGPQGVLLQPPWH